ncbi:competence protein CoiA family protein [Pseudarthrobacter sp. O4]|uniref:competence protein CoiA family protein n=1 Tax=Pseudarthrobacter sp. O4 TaxID=3418417 RepID=UPI003CEB2E71
MKLHDDETLREFLDAGETRQLWARHRITGERIYLKVGEANLKRSEAKANWACIIPYCDVAINTRGGSKRDSFYHPKGHDHGGNGPETLNHLAGKAMLLTWADAQAPEATVTEETTLKDKAMDFHRRPDVLVRWDRPTEMLLALEVEYKNFAYGPWIAKQNDFTAQDIASTWLLGHTNFKPTRKQAGSWDRTVKVPSQANIIAETGKHVLIINPGTEQIGTLAGDKGFTTKVASKQATAWLALEAIADCELTPDGLITPTMRRIDKAIKEREEAEAERRRQAEEARLRELAEKQRLKEEEERKKREEQERTERWALWRSEWEQHSLRAEMIERWVELPKVIDNYDNKPGGIHANPVHWHAVLYERLVHPKQPGEEITEQDCWKVLSQERIPTSRSISQRTNSLQSFLTALAKEGLTERIEKGWVLLRKLETLEQKRARNEALLREREQAPQEEQQLKAHEEQRKAATQATLRQVEEERSETETRAPQEPEKQSDEKRTQASDEFRLTPETHSAAHLAPVAKRVISPEPEDHLQANRSQHKAKGILRKIGRFIFGGE